MVLLLISTVEMVTPQAVITCGGKITLHRPTPITFIVIFRKQFFCFIPPFLLTPFFQFSIFLLTPPPPPNLGISNTPAYLPPYNSVPESTLISTFSLFGCCFLSPLVEFQEE